MQIPFQAARGVAWPAYQANYGRGVSWSAGYGRGVPRHRVRILKV